MKMDVKTPEKMYNVSQTQLSVARFYGGCIFNGVHYSYEPETDTLIRADILRDAKKCSTSK